MAPCTGTQQYWNPDSNSEHKHRVWVDLRLRDTGADDDLSSREMWWTLQPTAVSTVRGGTGGLHPLPAFCVVMARLKVPPWLGLRLLLFDPAWLLTAVRFHLEVSTNAVVLRQAAAVVDDPTLIRTLVWWLDAGEAELVWDVASSHFDHLKKMYEIYFFKCVEHTG